MRIWRVIYRKYTQMKVVGWNIFAFVRCYVDAVVSLDSAEEAERLVAWGCEVILMDLQ